MRSLLEKLGVGPDSRVSVIGLEDPPFLAALHAVTPHVREDTVPPGSDIVLLRASSAEDLAKLAVLRGSIARDGAIWVLWPKGRREFNQTDVMRAGLSAGLVDVKVVSFSDELSALKFVIRVADR